MSTNGYSPELDLPHFLNFLHIIILSLGATTTSEIDAVIKNFTDRLYHKRNARNLRAFVQSFRARTELTHDDLNAMRPNVLLVTGKEASFNHTVRGFTVYITSFSQSSMPCYLLYDFVALKAMIQ